MLTRPKAWPNQPSQPIRCTVLPMPKPTPSEALRCGIEVGPMDPGDVIIIIPGRMVACKPDVEAYIGACCMGAATKLGRYPGAATKLG
mmetsp:Transcript_72570/g.173168  ORF Transcript_72570/g.173168 Transcript_72570/m.173168 type:complete len:88 (+) Transcript_72570:192-455(+)